jgi:hypothetical protein
MNEASSSLFMPKQNRMVTVFIACYFSNPCGVLSLLA